MTNNTCLTSYHTAFADLRRARYPCLSGNNSIFPYFNIVSNLNLIIKFNAFANKCFTHHSSVD